MTSTIKVLVKIETVPDGEFVKKLGGTIPYQVLRNIKIFKSNNECVNIIADYGTVFIVNGSNINSISNSIEVVWETEIENLQNRYK